jgi:hypothetical protein
MVLASLKQRWQKEAVKKADLQLLKAVAFFAGAIVLSRNFGDAFAI